MAKIGKSKLAIGAAVLALAGASYLALSHSEASKAQSSAANSKRPAVPVTVAAVEAKDVPVIVRGLGNVQAYKTVAVKSRVDGQIVKIAFEEGQNVKVGDPLFQIDPRPFQASLDQAAANKQKDQAQLEGAQLDLERYGKLIGSGFQSKQSYDQQKATVEALKGSLAADQAQIDTARLNLAYADIRSPIDGRTGQRLIDLGNLVQAGQGVTLVTITEIKPIFVNFTIPQYANHNLRKAQEAHPLVVTAYSADDRFKIADGEITLIDNQIDAATGTLRLKGTFTNDDERLWPGQFVNVHLQLSVRKGAITVPQNAVMQGPAGPYAYVVKSDNTAERRAVEVESTQDGIAVIAKGVQIGEKIVVEGQYRLSNGSAVRLDQPTANQQPPAAEASDKKG